MGGSAPFGDEFRRLRIAAGLSQDRLADVAGVTAKTIRSLENADGSRPRASTLGRLFDGLELEDDKRLAMMALLDQQQGSSGSSTAEPPTSTDGAGATTEDGQQGQSNQPGTADKQNQPGRAAAASGAGELLLELRTGRGWTQRELANRAGVHHRTISDLERGTTSSAQPGTAFRIAQAAGLRGDELDRFVAVVTGSYVPGAETPTRPEHLYGRVEELAALLELIAGNRLVSVVGSGGVGKTTLARAAASVSEGSTAFVELADQPAGTPLAVALSEALGTDGSTIADLVAGLTGQTLVVIDNVEHLSATEATIDELLRDLPDTGFLLTSRRTVDAGTTAAEGSVATLRLDPLDPVAAVSLLRQRAAEAGCTEAWVLDDGPYDEICRRVDHLPLAIDLAAAWSSLLSPDELVERLKEPLALLDRRGDGDDRHDSVRSVVGWTLGLLSEQSTRLFAELSVHPTSFTLDLAERLHDDAGDVLEAVGELVDAGLVTVIGDQSPTRFRMLRVVREAGAELLDDRDRLAELQDRRDRWVLDLTAVTDGYLTGPEQESWLRRLDLEREHINQAFDHLVEIESPRAVDLTAGMWRYWHLRSLYARGRDRITLAVAIADAESAPEYGTAQYGRAVLGYLAGDVDHAVIDAKAALECYRQRSQEHGMGSVYSLLGMIDQYQGRLEESEAWYRSGLDQVSARGAPRAFATLQANLGSLFGQIGRLDEAITLVEEAIARFETLGDERGVADNAGNMALWELASGAPEQARATLNSVLAVFERLADPQGEADTRLGLAEAAMWLGELDVAETELTAADVIIEEIRDPWGLALAAAHRSMLMLLTGDTEGGLRLARRARIEADALPYEHAQLRAYVVEAVSRASQGRQLQAAEAALRGIDVAGDGNPVVTGSLAMLVAGLAGLAGGVDDDRPALLFGQASNLVLSVRPTPLLDRIDAVAPQPMAQLPASSKLDESVNGATGSADPAALGRLRDLTDAVARETLGAQI